MGALLMTGAIASWIVGALVLVGGGAGVGAVVGAIVILNGTVAMVGGLILRELEPAKSEAPK